MSLSWTELEGSDPLPEPDWAERVVAVIRASGRLSDDTYDDFDDWMEALADATHGAVYSYPSGSFIHVWADADPEGTAARARALLDAGDFAGLAAWIRALEAAQENSDAAESQLNWIVEIAMPAIEGRVAAGDAGPAPAIAALYDVLSDRLDYWKIEPLVLAAAALPKLARDTAVQTRADQLRDARARAEAAALPLPEDLDALQRLLDEAMRGDPRSFALLERFSSYEPRDRAKRQRLVLELARSGREVPVLLSCQLVELLDHVPELQGPEKLEAFAAHGSLASQISAALAERERHAQDRRSHRAAVIADRAAEYDAYYGRDRKRPRMPDDLVAMIRRGELPAAVAAYRERFPKNAREAGQAVEDIRAHFAPDIEPLAVEAKPTKRKATRKR